VVRQEEKNARRTAEPGNEGGGTADEDDFFYDAGS